MLAENYLITATFHALDVTAPNQLYGTTIAASHTQLGAASLALWLQTGVAGTTYQCLLRLSTLCSLKKIQLSLSVKLNNFKFNQICIKTY